MNRTVLFSLIAIILSLFSMVINYQASQMNERNMAEFQSRQQPPNLNTGIKWSWTR